MIALSTEYTVHFHDIYIDGKENAKMTGYLIRFLYENTIFSLMSNLEYLMSSLIQSFIFRRRYDSILKTFPSFFLEKIFL